MASAYNRYVNTYINNKETGVSIKDINSEYRKLSNTIKTSLIPGTKEYDAAVRKTSALKAVLDEHRAKVNGLDKVWQKISTEVKQFGVLALSALGAQQLISGINNLIQRNAALSDSLADVRKTTGLTDTEVKELYEDLSKFHTRTARKELLDLARDAGKLGITGKKDILEFVRAADKMNVSLGEDLGKDAITQVGKLAQQFKVVDQFGFEKSLDKIGSAINDLGANSAAQEQYIVDFTTRIAGVAKQAKITVQDTLGLASTLDNLGLQSETASTAVGQTIVAMFKDTATFAKIAGLNTEEFSNILNNNANDALQLVLKGLRGNNEGLTTMAGKLDALGVDGSRAITVLASLAENTELLQQQQELANKSFEQGVSLTNEFNIKNETLGAKLERVQKAIYGAFISSDFAGALENIVSKLDKWLNVSEKQQTVLANTQRELNNEIEALKAGNLTAEERSRLIKEINEEYGDYLPQLFDEKMTLQEIETLQEGINKQFMLKILLMDYEEDIKQIYEDQKAALEGSYNAKKQLAQIKADPGVLQDNAAAIAATQNMLETTVDFNKVIADLAPKRLADTEEKYKALAEAMGGVWENLKNTLNAASGGLGKSGTNNPNIPGIPSKDLTEKEITRLKEQLTQFNEQLRIAQLEGDAQQFARIDAKYQKELDELQTFLDKKIITQAEFDEKEKIIVGLREDEKNAIRLNKEREFQNQVNTLREELFTQGLSRDEQELQQIDLQYEALLNKLDTLYQQKLISEQEYQAGSDNIRELWNAAYFAQLDEFHKRDQAAESDNQQKLNSIRRQALSDTKDAIGNVLNLMAEQSSVAAQFAKSIGLFEIGVHLAKAVAGAVAAAQTLPFPANLAAAASGVATVTASILQAKNLMAKQKPPKAPSFYGGGPTGPGIGMRDSSGHYVAGVVHANEYVAPQNIYEDPRFADIFSILESARTGRGYAQGGAVYDGKGYANFAIQPGKGGMQMTTRDPEVMRLLKIIAKNTAQPIALIDDRAATDMRDRIDEVNTIESKGGIG